MDFYGRYEMMCQAQGIDPCSQKTAERLRTTRSNISYWKKGTKPNIDRVCDAADMLQVSTDYLLGRTDDPTDYTSAKRKQPSVPTDVIALLSCLDSSDLERVSIYAKGLLDGDKYQKSQQSNEKAI